MISLTEKKLSIKSSFLALVFLFAITQSCRKTSTHYVETNKYPSGELLSEIPFLEKDSLKDGTYKEYHKNGNLKKIILFKKGVPVDSAMQYFNSGQIEFKEIRNLDTIHTYHYFKTGEIALHKKFLNRKNPLEIGWSKYFDKNGSISDSIEHIDLKSISYLNQHIRYDSQNKLVSDSSNFFRFSLNSIQNSDLFSLKVAYVPKYKNADVFMVLGDNLNDDFSNVDTVELDTIFMQNNEISSQLFEKDSRVFKGFFYEYLIEELEEVSTDSIKLNINEKKTFFNMKLAAKKKSE